MQSEVKFQKICANLKRFEFYFTLDDDAYEGNVTGQFKKCTNCNRPTINHDNPIDSKCTLEIVDDPDEMYDIEENLQSKQEFKEALAKLWEKAVNDEIIRELTTCYICQKFCKTEIDLKKHKINFHKFTEAQIKEEETDNMIEEISDSSENCGNNLLKELPN